MNSSKKRSWTKYALFFIIIIGVSVNFYCKQRSADAAGQSNVEVAVPPGGKRATLTLGDGRTITLDSSAKGEPAREGFSKIIRKTGGEIEYTVDPPGANMTEAGSATNTLRTPKGGEYQLTLADGTHAWLNAASSITYPAVFVGNERRVEVTGEVYFEVAHKANRPFIVAIKGAEIQVLGTTFNVNAYGDETWLSTTLLEGSLMVKDGIALEKLKPGQQAQITKQRFLEVVPEIDTAAVIAWKNGIISLDGHSLETNLKQLARWYDVTVVLKGDMPALQLKGSLERSLSLSQALQRLKSMGLHARLEEKKLIILP